MIQNILVTGPLEKIERSKKNFLLSSHLLSVAVLLNLLWGLAVNTWPGLCTILVQCIAKELGTSSGKKRGPDATVSKTFRRFVQTANDERRSGLHVILFEHGLAHSL